MRPAQVRHAEMPRVLVIVITIGALAPALWFAPRLREVPGLTWVPIAVVLFASPVVFAWAFWGFGWTLVTDGARIGFRSGGQLPGSTNRFDVFDERELPHVQLRPIPRAPHHLAAYLVSAMSGRETCITAAVTARSRKALRRFCATAQITIIERR
jgi:hypothetical protein